LSRKSPTSIGRVRHVLGATVTVELERELAGVEPLWEGRLQAVGQVGSLVRIPQGPITLIAAVTLVGIAELNQPSPPAFVPQTGDRWLQVQLIGELGGVGQFHRGVSRYPGLDDEVHFTTSKQLYGIYPGSGRERLSLGRLSAAPDVEVSLDARALVVRHSAVVGSTGSGKTSAVARILQGISLGPFASANVVVIDPHGEYSTALASAVSVRSAIGDGDRLLRVPYWVLPAAEILRAFCGPIESSTINSRFSELCGEARRNYVRGSSWLAADPGTITADSPVPFDISDVWYRLQYENTATFSKAGGNGDPAVEDKGDAASFRPPRFTPYAAGNVAPFKGLQHSHFGNVPERIRARALDDRFRFFREPSSGAADCDPLVEVVDEWLGSDKPVSVLDFSGVPAEAADLAVGAILQTIFEIAVRSRADGIGRPRPILFVLEEAHRYLGDGPSVRLARDSANRIAREGRKYGVGLMLVSQRPSELPSTALSQCGTVIALRLSNGSDQGAVKAALPDSLIGLANVLPSLRTGEAVVSGEAITLPSRVRVEMPDPRPDAGDPGLEGWLRPRTKNDLVGALERWRNG
jgi:hypothetical protein